MLLYILYNMRRILASRKTPQGPNCAKNIVRRASLRTSVAARDKKQTDSKKISNFLPIIIYTIFVQIAIGKPKKFVYFSAKVLSIFLTIYWKSVFRSVIMDYANMIYVMHTSKTNLGGKL